MYSEPHSPASSAVLVVASHAGLPVSCMSDMTNYSSLSNALHVHQLMRKLPCDSLLRHRTHPFLCFNKPAAEPTLLELSLSQAAGCHVTVNDSLPTYPI